VIVSGKKALFLDRDGVINHDSGYTSNADDFKFIDGVFELCRVARQLDYLLIVVTNQAGIGRGYYTEQDFLTLTAWMSERFEAEGAPLTDVFYCPDHPEYGVGDFKKDSFDRKPNPGMLLRANEKYGIDFSRSMMIGDKVSDMQAAERAGVGTRCHYLVNEHLTDEMSSAATHKIHSLHEAILLLSKSTIACNQ
jgi:D-glycero-D-manno-heptose 1,7-bisphosphate phosphatase